MLALTLVPLVPWPKNADEKTYNNSGCGISFRYPEEWLVKQSPLDPHGPRRRICVIRLQPKDLARHLKEDGNLDAYTIDIYVDDSDYAGALGEAGFEQGETGWVVHGTGAGDSRAEDISSPERVGMKATTTDRCYREDDGGYAGLCESFHAVLSDRSDLSATIDARPQSEDVFNSVLKSLKFTATIPSKEHHRK